MTNPDRTEAPGDVILATITITRSITPDGEYGNSYTCTGEPGLDTARGKLTSVQHAIPHSAYHPTGESE